jgi:hypothetical protein
MAVNMSMSVLWVVTTCGLVGRCQRFGETYFLHLQGMFFRNSGIYTQVHTALLPRRLIFTCQESLSPGRDLNPGPPEYRAGVLIPWLLCSVPFYDVFHLFVFVGCSLELF